MATKRPQRTDPAMSGSEIMPIPSEWLSRLVDERIAMRKFITQGIVMMYIALTVAGLAYCLVWLDSPKVFIEYMQGMHAIVGSVVMVAFGYYFGSPRTEHT